MQPVDAEPCASFVHGGFGRLDRDKLIVECTVHPQWVRKVSPRKGENAADRRARAKAVGAEHERSGR